ncbi:MAG: metallophosphoesterase [Bradymonadales bacterium]|nr:metallophosphoesterase [Bradymonadales bacterium]
MRLCHISDTHFGSGSHFNRQVFVDSMLGITKEHFDVVIHTGDVTDDGRLEHFREAKKHFDELGLPLVVIPGNHDARSGGIAIFEEYLGPANGVKVIGDALIIHINSATPDNDDGRVGMVKFNLIKEALSSYPHLPIKIVAIHHHVIPIPKAGRERNILSNAGDLLDLFLRNDVDLVLSGHRHYPNVYKVESTVLVNAGTLSGRKTRYGDVNSYNLVEIEEEQVIVETRRIDGSREQKRYPRRCQSFFHDFGRRELRLVHMSNTMITEGRVFLKKAFDSAVNTINSLDADLAIHCGGIVYEGIPEDYNLAKRKMAKIKVPVLYTPAGRDTNYLGFHLFTQSFGPVTQQFANEWVHVQGLASFQYDTTIGIIGETERNTFFSKMRSVASAFRVMFLHHNITPVPHARERGLLEDSGDLLRRAVDEGIDLVLTGTSSHPNAMQVENTVIVNANSLSCIYQRSLFGNSFNLIDIYEHCLVVSEINSLWGARRIVGMWGRAQRES